jgi:homoserine O-acetyltransferase
MLKNDYYSQELHGPYELFPAGDFELEGGGTIRNCQVAYATFGRLSAKKDNAILITTWYSGTNKIMEQVYVGKGRALDPEKYFIIIVNQLGSGLSSSPHNTPPPFNMSKFPHVTIGDDVRVQHKLVTEKFGLERLELVVGGSMGAQQVYEWAVRYPEIVKRAAPLAGTAKNTPHDFLFTETLNEAITSDPAWSHGFYKDSQDVHLGLRRQARIWAVMGLSTEFYKRELWRGLGFSSVEDFVTGFIEGYFLPMDPNDLLCMAWKWQRGDVSKHTNGDLKKALARIKAKVFVMPISEDMFFPVRDCAFEQELIPNSELRVINSVFGHFALFGIEPEYREQVDKHLNELLAIPA